MAFSKEKFSNLLQNRGIKASHVAEQLGVARSTVSHWGAGRTTPNEKLYQQIAEILECEVDDFLQKEGDIVGQRRAGLRDSGGRIKHETRYDSMGNVWREYWNLELTPAIWGRLQECMKADGFPENDVDGYLQTIINEKYADIHRMRRSSDPLDNDEWTDEGHTIPKIKRHPKGDGNDQLSFKASIGSGNPLERKKHAGNQHKPDNQS